MCRALAGGFLITGLPGKSHDNNLLRPFSNFTLRYRRVKLNLFLQFIPDTARETNKQKNTTENLTIHFYLPFSKKKKKPLKKRDYKTKF